MFGSKLLKYTSSRKDNIIYWRTKVISSLVVMIIVLLINEPALLIYINNIEIQRDLNALTFLILAIHAFFCGMLYYAISENALGSFAVGILINFTTWFLFGIIGLLLTIYLIIKARKMVKIME